MTTAYPKGANFPDGRMKFPIAHVRERTKDMRAPFAPFGAGY
jgi:hypothetical protein